MVLSNWLVLATAGTGEAAGAAAPKGLMGLGPGGDMIVMFLILGAIFYFLVFKPQQNQKRQHQDMLSKLKAGDRVLTYGGMYGVNHTIKRDSLLLKVDEKVRIEMALGSIASVVAPDAGAAEADKDAKGDDKDKAGDKSHK